MAKVSATMQSDRSPRGGAPEDADTTVPNKRPEVEQRPPVPSRTSRYTAYWWDSTAETPEFRDTREQVTADNHDLFPFDRRRQRRNAQQGEFAGMRSKADARIVQNPHLYRAAQRAQAMTLPDGHSFEFKPQVSVPSKSQQESPLGAPQDRVQFADTMTRLLKTQLEEIHWDNISEDWIRDACFYRAGMLKMWFQSEYLTDPLSTNRLHDMQDELTELESLWSDYRAGIFDDNDGRFQRMLDMQMAIQDKTQLSVWQGFCSETVSLERFRIDPRITSVDSFYSAKWMSEDLVMTKRDILSRFPFIIDEEGKKDGSNPKGFWGIHRDDLNNASYYDNSGDYIKNKEEERRQVDRDTRQTRLTDEQTAYDSLDDDDVLFLVRQIFIRDEGKVMVLINGLEYPAAEWVPKNTHAGWYPFFPVVMNRQSGSWYGRSDTELASDEQARLNMKMTDTEKMRELAKPRGVINGANVDEQEAWKLNQLEGGEFRTINVPGGTLTENLMWLTYNYPIHLEDVSMNLRMFDKMVGFSEAFMGNMGGQGANFATEVAVMAQGANIMIRQRQATVRRALNTVYTACAEILMQVYTEEDVKLIVGDDAYWPHLYGEEIATKLKRELTMSAITQVKTEMAAIQQDENPLLAAQQYPGIENPQQRARMIYEEMAQQEWGQLEPLTRDSLFKRLHLVVDTNPNGMLDRQQKLQNVLQFSQALAQLGVRLAPKAMGRILAELLEQEENVDDLIMVDPNVATGDVVIGLQNNPQEFLPESLSKLAAAGQVANEMLTQMAEAEGQRQAQQLAADAERVGDEAALAEELGGGGEGAAGGGMEGMPTPAAQGQSPLEAAGTQGPSAIPTGPNAQ